MSNSSDNSETGKMHPLVETMPADLLTPLAVYLKLNGAKTDSFLLESVEGGTNVARYSFIGVDPQFRARGVGNQVEIIKGEVSEFRDQTLFDFLRGYFSSLDDDPGDQLLPFFGGAIGFLGFDCAEWFEPSLGSKNTAASEFMFFDSIVAFDHVKQEIKIMTRSVKPEEGEAKNGRIRSILESGEVRLPRETITDHSLPVTSNWAKDEFEASVREIKELIEAGECYQVVLSQRFQRKTSASPVSIYRALRSINPSPYMFLLNLGGRAIIGASPEMLVRCRGRKLEYRPIAGTRPRGNDPIHDEDLANEMRADKKEVAEHAMLVDLGRNDLGRVASHGSVKVDRLMEVEKFSHVQHLVSDLSAELGEGFDRFDAFAACFPAGTVSGAPKVRAIEIIRRLEPTPRGVYAGAVGYFDHAGNMDTCIAIRTLVLENGVATIQAGAGIVADSIPELEFEETVNKAAALLKAIDIAEANAR